MCGSFCCCTKLLQNDVKNSKKISASVIVYNVLKNSAVCVPLYVAAFLHAFPQKVNLWIVWYLLWLEKEIISAAWLVLVVVGVSRFKSFKPTAQFAQ